MSLKQTILAVVGGGGLVYVALATRAVPPDVSSLERSLLDPVPPARADISGTRLKTKYIAGADGSRVAIDDVRWDSELQTDCTFRTAADGTTRCLPLGPEPVFGGGYNFVLYLDSACTDGLVWVAPPSPGCPAAIPEYAIVGTAPPYCSGEPMREHIYPVGALLPPLTGAVFLTDWEGNCQVTSIPQNNGIPYAIGAEMPASSFAAGTGETDP